MKWALIRYGWCIKRRSLDIGAGAQGEEHGKMKADLRDGSPSQEMLRLPGNHQNPGERCETDPFLPPSEGAQPCQHLGSELLASRIVRQNFLSPQVTQVVIC